MGILPIGSVYGDHGKNTRATPKAFDKIRLV